jgi:hypothetical protein
MVFDHENERRACKNDPGLLSVQAKRVEAGLKEGKILR